jgi:hypothetical protein
MQMADIVNNISLNLRMIKVLLLEMIALKAILLITIKPFWQPEASGTSLMEDQIMDIPHVSQEENGFLIGPFTESEVRNVVFQMEHNKALSPDGFPTKFYQVLCGIIK